MSLRHALLGVLSVRDMTGYDIKRQFDRSVHFVWNASDSQIYRELRDMESDGLVLSTWIAQTGKPSRRAYQLTPAGESELDSWIESLNGWESLHDKDAFLLRMFFIGRAPTSSALGLLRARVADVDKAMAYYERRLSEFSDISRSRHPRVLQWQHHLLEGMRAIDQAQRDWLLRLIDELEQEQGAAQGNDVTG